MTHASKRQCLSSGSSTSLGCTQDTQSLGKGNPNKHTVSYKVQQLAIAMAQNDRCIFELRSDGSIGMTPLKSYQLPNEIIAKVLDHVTDSRILYECTLTSKHCYAIANPLLWKAPPDFAFIDCMNRMPCDRRDALGQHIRVLNGSLHQMKDEFLGLLPCFWQLTHLDGLDYLNSKEDHLVLRSCPRLLAFDASELMESEIPDIPKYLPHLESFSWFVPAEQSPSLLNHFSACPLRYLNLFFEDVIRDATVLTTIKTFDQLKSLTIVQLYGNSLKALLDPSAFLHLTVLELEWCDDTDDTTMIAFLKTHPMLEQLHLNKFFSLTDATLDAICGLSRLANFAICHNDHITTAAIRRVIKACPLTHLDVTNCEQVEHDGFPELACVGILDEQTLDKIRRSFGLV